MTKTLISHLIQAIAWVSTATATLGSFALRYAGDESCDNFGSCGAPINEAFLVSILTMSIMASIWFVAHYIALRGFTDEGE